MIGFIQSKAASGNAEAINTLEMLRSIGFIKDEPKAEEPKLWELFAEAGMYCEPKRYRKSAGRILKTPTAMNERAKEMLQPKRLILS